MFVLPHDSDYEVWQKAFHGMSGTIPDCWSARNDLIRGEFAAVCYEMTMMKTISWDFSISRLIEAGLLDYWLISEISNTTQCLKPPTADRSQGVQPLSLTSLLGTMYLLAAGWSMALLIFVTEYLAAALKPPAPPPLPSVTVTPVNRLQEGAMLHHSHRHFKPGGAGQWLETLRGQATPRLLSPFFVHPQTHARTQLSPSVGENHEREDHDKNCCRTAVIRRWSENPAETHSSFALTFRYELVRPPDSYWGIKFPNGSWNGMVGMVHRNEVEMALGPFAVTAQREEDIDFSMAVLTDNQAIITIRPTLQQDVAGFLRPFDYKVWLLVLLSMVGMACGMVGVVEGEGKVFFENPKNIVSKTCLWILTTLTQESSEWLPPHDAGRVLVTTWMLASLVFMSSYGGILTAMLTVPRVTIPIDSLADLVAQDDLPWRLESGATMLTLLQESEDEVRQKAYHGMSGTIPDCWSARHGLIKGEFAAVCDMMTMKKTISWDFSISRLLEAGILNHWLSSETSNTTQCLKPPSADRSQGVEPLPLSSMLGTILLMAGGWSLALLIFIGENIMVATMTPSPHSALRSCIIYTSHLAPRHAERQYTPRSNTQHLEIRRGGNNVFFCKSPFKY
ncbi:hypothetical protein O3P69_000285 [Scylla paramamosain]|uniref:Uncharacterized protein n=1 Tax=Scylla paramamosain TaxID=85552 RepID=A0AAW0UVE4_SCYPA